MMNWADVGSVLRLTFWWKQVYNYILSFDFKTRHLRICRRLICSPWRFVTLPPSHRGSGPVNVRTVQATLQENILFSTKIVLVNRYFTGKSFVLSVQIVTVYTISGLVLKIYFVPLMFGVKRFAFLCVFN